MYIIDNRQLTFAIIIYIVLIVIDIILLGQNYRYRKYIDKTIYKDELTHIFNRRYGTLTLERIYSGEIPDSFPLSVILIDIDDFKEYNDTYGHSEGDVALKIIAEELNKFASKNIIPYRYGGEEFILILRNTPLSEAQLIAEKIVTGVEVVHHRSILLKRPITVSAGIHSVESANREINGLITSADKALYSAKKAGKNRVCYYK